MLSAAGYDVVAARDGAEALELARQSPPDVLITDLNMPAVDGAELCRRLAGDPATAAVQVIVITCRDVRPGPGAGLPVGPPGYHQAVPPAGSYSRSAN